MSNEVYEFLLKSTLALIESNDPSSFTFVDKEGDVDAQVYYDKRNELVHEAVYLARKLGYQAGYLVHTPIEDLINKGWDDNWGVVARIELPTGQVAWHIESPKMPYDGHTAQDKHNRIQAYVKGE